MSDPIAEFFDRDVQIDGSRVIFTFDSHVEAVATLNRARAVSERDQFKFGFTVGFEAAETARSRGQIVGPISQKMLEEILPDERIEACARILLSDFEMNVRLFNREGRPRFAMWERMARAVEGSSTYHFSDGGEKVIRTMLTAAAGGK